MKYLVQGIERQDWLQRFTIEADSREQAIQGVLEGDGERTNWLDDEPLESDFTDIHRWRVIEEDGEPVEDDKTGENLSQTMDLNATGELPASTAKALELAGVEIEVEEEQGWPRHWFNFESRQIITEAKQGDLTPAGLAILANKTRFLPCDENGYIGVPAVIISEMKELTVCLQDLLDNTEIDALNEPELEARCERARQAIARATGKEL